MYKMVPVPPELYALLEETRDSWGLASFADLLYRFVGRPRPKSRLGSHKGEAWLRDIQRDRVDRF